MNCGLRIHLHADPQQAERLHRLQTEFAQVCNALAPLAQSTRCWNRVALHHMAYRQMRERFPNLGSQMICNAIYSVSRTCRAVYQGVNSPFHIARLGPKPLPLVKFLDSAPVYFDRHTISIKDGQASMFTLDGRMKFEIKLPPSDLQRLATQRVVETVLTGSGRKFTLTFMFEQPKPQQVDPSPETTVPHAALHSGASAPAPLPSYVKVLPIAMPRPAAAVPSKGHP